MLTVRTAIAVFTLSCTALLLAQQRPLAKSIDFRNFTYPLPSVDLDAVPAELTWMSMDVKRTVTLVNGRYDFDKDESFPGPSVILDRVLYGYLTPGEQLDAVVVLGYHTGGTAYWDYVYAFSLASNRAKLVGWFRAGSRADFGLHNLYFGGRELTIDLLDPTRREGDCCSDGFVRSHYEFRDGHFTKRGPQEFGSVEWSKPASGNRLPRRE